MQIPLRRWLSLEPHLQYGMKGRPCKSLGDTISVLSCIVTVILCNALQFYNHSINPSRITREDFRNLTTTLTSFNEMEENRSLSASRQLASLSFGTVSSAHKQINNQRNLSYSNVYCLKQVCLLTGFTVTAFDHLMTWSSTKKSNARYEAE